MRSGYSSLKVRAFLLLAMVFACYNWFVYTHAQPSTDAGLSPSAQKGQALWLQHNCNSCHQLYGLGGYLGPDLTNVYAHKGAPYTKAMLNSGVRVMPRFSFSEEEMEAMVAFLQEVNKTGSFPDKNAFIGYDGWVNLKGEHEQD